MKTIQIPDELYNDIMDIAKEYVTQDKRHQAEPCMFTPKQKIQVLKPDNCGSHSKFILRDDYDIEFDSYDELQEYYEYNKHDELNNVSFEEMCEDFDEVYYDIEDSFQNRGTINPFFTAKYCDIYIHNDRHNLEDKNAVSYAFTPQKNFEMITIAKLLTILGNINE